MKINHRHNRRTWWRALEGASSALLLLAAALLPSAPALAQLESSYQEVEVQAVGEERVEEQGPSAREELGSQTRATARWFEQMLDLSELERLDAAIHRLRNLVDQTPHGSSEAANYSYRLAELYYRKARLFEQRAYDRMDQAYAVREVNPAQAQQYELRSQDDLEQSDRNAALAIDVYADLYQNYRGIYPAMDAVLFYLGSTLSQLGRNEDALDFFQELANDYPNSPFMPQALLAFGEYYFQAGDAEQAQLFYNAVTEFPESSIYPYALYQEAWCYYNLGQSEQAIQRLLDSIAASAGDAPGAIRMRNLALQNLALFYVEVGSAASAFGFLEQVAPDRVMELAALIARIYSEDGNYEEGNTLYRELIARNRDSFSVMEYQYEIVQNTIPSGDEESIVREVRRLVELFSSAQQYPDADPASINQQRERIEYLVRRLATTYHRDARVTRNPTLYALAYNLYEDYINHFRQDASPETAYTMSFYYAELLYRHERYADAAHMWEDCLSINPQGEYNEEAIYKAVLSYTHLVDLETTVQVAMPQVDPEAQPTGELPQIQPIELPEEMQRLVQAADRYIGLDPPPQYAVEVKYVAARVLYDYAHLNEAVERFGDIALTYHDVDPERSRVSAELLLDSLAALQDFQRMEEWVNRLRASPLNRGEFAPRLSSLGQTISFGQCRNVQLTGQLEQAGLCYFDFFREYSDSEMVDRALYNAALCFDEVQMIARAIRVRELLIEFRPDSDLIPETMFTLGRSFHRLALYRSASEYYERYGREHPQADNAMEALANAAIFRQGLGEYDQAIAIYQAIIRQFSRAHPREAAEAFYQIAAIHLKRGQNTEALEEFQEYLSEWARRGHPGRAIEADTRVGVLLWESRRDRAIERFVSALDRYNNLSEEDRSSLLPPSLDAAAEARFMLGEDIFRQFSAITIEGNERQAQERLRQKYDMGNQAGQVYAQVERFQRPGWSIAAFTRLGQLYHEFYEAVHDAPIPRGMSVEVEEAYRSMIEEQMTEVREQAITNYHTALDIARTAGWFNEYSTLAERNLAILDPSFRAAAEVRAQPGFESHPVFRTEYRTTLSADEEGVEEETEETAEEELLGELDPQSEPAAQSTPTPSVSEVRP
ncbi:MAG: tetratricopeptide repeat protein [Bradymonadales bacterium]|nr:tetratricopeptide repeat protein [Bradymonadales bacterium]